MICGKNCFIYPLTIFYSLAMKNSKDEKSRSFYLLNDTQKIQNVVVGAAVFKVAKVSVLFLDLTYIL